MITQKDIIGIEWRSGRKTVGIVAVNTARGWKAYIGPAEDVSPTLDAIEIVSWGAKLKKSEAMAFFPFLNAETYDL